MKLSILLQGVQTSTFEDREITGITCDSRQVMPGYAFVCIPGTAQDGHQYAPQAVEKGAAVVIAQRDLGLANQVLVPSTRKAWAQMCANWFGRPAEKLNMIGVTGTNGKSTVTNLLKHILEHCGYKVGLVGTIQNLIGDQVFEARNTTPDPYELHGLLAKMVEAGCQYVVMEVSSHALDQDRVEGCHFAAGIFTNLTQDHLDYHGTMERYMEAKKRLFFQSGIAVINLDDQWAGPISEGVPAKVVTYSARQDIADYTAKNIRYLPDRVEFEFVGMGAIARVRLHLPGLFSVYNAMAAGTCALALGFSFDQVMEGLSSAEGVKGRAEIVPTGRDYTVIIDYAHTPDGIENIARTLKQCCTGRLVILFGCGGDRDRIKRPLMGAAAARYGDFLIVTSDNPRSEDPAAIIADILPGITGNTGADGQAEVDAGDGRTAKKVPYKVIENRVEAIHWALDHAQPGDIILLAGKGHETYQILKDKTIHLDEREIVRAHLGLARE